MKTWIALHILFVLATQFAPTIHNAFPHEEEKSSCSHSDRSLHLEKSENHASTACVFCAHAGGRATPLPAFTRISAEQISLRTASAPDTVLPERLALLIPESRGPPAGL